MKNQAWIALLMIGGCATETDSGTESSALISRAGVDYSFDRPSPSGLAAGGYSFAVRYLSTAPNCKNLTAGEASRLGAAGIDVVVNWENNGDEATAGRDQGRQDAMAAQQQAAAAGVPGDRPIYFAVDFAPATDQLSAIDAYFDGVASVIGRARVGAYGGYDVIKRLFDASPPRIAFGWQTHSWSNGQLDSRAQLYQALSAVTIAGGECDEDVAMAADFGQWRNTAPPQSPQACSGYGCDDLDPTQSVDSSTGALCSSGAWTVKSIGAVNGTLEMRWGPRCQVNWARFTPNASGFFYRIRIERQSVAGQQPHCPGARYTFNSSAGVQYFSDQVYAPGPARACVEQLNGTSVTEVCTPYL